MTTSAPETSRIITNWDALRALSPATQLAIMLSDHIGEERDAMREAWPRIFDPQIERGDPVRRVPLKILRLARDLGPKLVPGFCPVFGPLHAAGIFDVMRVIDDTAEEPRVNAEFTLIARLVGGIHTDARWYEEPRLPEVNLSNHPHYVWWTKRLKPSTTTPVRGWGVAVPKHLVDVSR